MNLDKKWRDRLAHHDSDRIRKTEDGRRDDPLVLLEPVVADLGGHARDERAAHAGQGLTHHADPVPCVRAEIISHVWKGWKAAEKASEKGQHSADVKSESEAETGDDVSADDAERHPDAVGDGQYAGDVFCRTLSL